MRRNAVLFVLISLCSGFGSTAMALAAGLWILELTGSVGLAALAGLGTYLPVLTAPWLGALVDRFPRRPLVITVDLVLGAAILTLLAAPSAAWIYAILLLRGFSYVLLDAGESALLPAAVPTESLGDVNGWRSSAQEGAKLLAPLAGAALYAWRGPHAVVLLCAALPLLTAAMYGLVRLRPSTPKPAADEFAATPVAGECAATPVVDERGAAPVVDERGVAPVVDERGVAAVAGERGMAPAMGECAATRAASKCAATQVVDGRGVAPLVDERGAARAVGECAVARVVAECAVRLVDERAVARAVGECAVARAAGQCAVRPVDERAVVPVVDERGAARVVGECAVGPVVGECGATVGAGERGAMLGWANVRAGLIALWREPMRTPVLVAAVAIAVSGMTNAAVLLHLVDGLHRPSTQLGILSSCQGAGSIVGGLLVGRLLARFTAARVAALGAVLFGMACVAWALPWWPAMIAGSVLAGIGLPWTLIAGVTAIQTGVPEHLLGRAAATGTMVMFGPIALGIPLGSALASLGAGPPLLLGAVTVLVTAGISGRSASGSR
ncbi:MFS transporter [Actinoplanes regularis]|uniref:Major Facilitator Superfamily protein n=1 Tax=Actinoplanes regularis TaxID=52697 RepID=A0A238WI91_9ACTN|nr:MFS transporter [Actinoplanes regularis]GIE84874.1 hypothetical protein Are01nite_13540 [Actinoplanes regularis]SNR46043.1 Major Facilitator Superfamily protein [Actinoplanes regularis]